MKTIAELAKECGVHRTTLNKAIERGAIIAQKSGDTWLIDEQSVSFKNWLTLRQGRPRGTKKKGFIVMKIKMWDYSVIVEFREHVRYDDLLLGQITLLLPETLHQQLQGRKPLKLICQGQHCALFSVGAYTENAYIGDKVSYECRISYAAGQKWSLIYGHTSYATLFIDAYGEASLHHTQSW